MAHYLYRINGGQVLGVSTSAFPTSTYFGSYEPSTKADGEDLSVPKIKDGTALRNATAPEIANFSYYENEDRLAESSVIQKTFFDSANSSGVLYIRSLLKILLDEINVVRNAVELGPLSDSSVITAIKADVDTELADFVGPEP